MYTHGMYTHGMYTYDMYTFGMYIIPMVCKPMVFFNLILEKSTYSLMNIGKIEKNPIIFPCFKKKYTFLLNINEISNKIKL